MLEGKKLVNPKSGEEAKPGKNLENEVEEMIAFCVDSWQKSDYNKTETLPPNSPKP